MTEPKGFSRRTFLKAAGGVLVMLGLGGAGIILRRKRLLRPPGGQNEPRFTSRCLKCDRCRSICPTSVIGLAHVEEGILDVRTPVMKFHLGYCNFCNKCVEVCPTHALERFSISTVKIGLAVITDRCIAWNYGGCNVCRQACPYHAITLDNHNRPVVDSTKCNGCGLCENICPALKLRSYLGGTLRGIKVSPISYAGDD